MKKIVLICLSIMLFGIPIAWGQSAQSSDPANSPSLLSSIKITPPLDFCGEPVPLNDRNIYESLEKELLMFVCNRAQVFLWIKRSGRYFPYIEKELKKNRMPDDLKYSAVIESSLLPHIGSSKGAVGFWQFIRSTGNNYDLRIDSNVDERRNLVSSTGAAVDYLKKLYNDFGSWTLAVAAYNMGESGLRSNIDFQKTNDFYHLYLPMETQSHILKIVAAKLILSNPEKYGFHFTQEDLYKPDTFDRVQVEAPAEIPIQMIAEAAKTYYKTIKDLNPELRGRNLPQGTYSVAVPKGSAKEFHARYNNLVEELMASKGKAPTENEPKKYVYVVKKGDQLARIAARFNVSMASIASWNSLSPRKPIQPGMRLVIYQD